MEAKNRYSKEELKEFETLILEKIQIAKKELDSLRASISHKNDESTETTYIHSKTLEDGAETAEREQLNQLAARQMKFIKNLENAYGRIQNGTYGVCIKTGKLIAKERLKAVPHTQHSIDAKKNSL